MPARVARKLRQGTSVVRRMLPHSQGLANAFVWLVMRRKVLYYLAGGESTGDGARSSSLEGWKQSEVVVQ
jgi:hypothetical protein